MNRIARPAIMREIDLRGPTVTTDTSAVARLEPGRVKAATVAALRTGDHHARAQRDQKTTRLNTSNPRISYAGFCTNKKNTPNAQQKTDKRALVRAGHQT